LSSNVLDKPLLNRATMDVLEPGSSVKPMVGLWGMKTGVLGIHEEIKCTGFMMYHGKRQSRGRCWVSRRILAYNPKTPLADMIDHPIPIPLGHDLTFADALERSCNPFHETIADRLGVERLSEGFQAFGLGQPTGVGIAERSGRLPDTYDGPNALYSLWSAGIGQGQVGATPMQMADVVATVARGGIWLRPTLLADPVPEDKLHRAVPTTRPARIDLHIPPDAIAMAHLGMWNVVHGAAGTGTFIKFPDVGVCGKTGTAQAASFLVPQLDADGQIVPRLDANGQPEKDKYGQVRPVLVPLEIGTAEHPNAIAPWYQGSGPSGKDLAHAWYIGFAPREHPRIAFCVLAEYGGSGGIAGAALAHAVMQACVDQGYLKRGE
jgi:penicillin-binding protein 2